MIPLMDQETMMRAKADLANRIKYHRPDTNGIDRIATMRAYAFEWGVSILHNVPDGREQSLALTKIEEALFWANAGIARDSAHWDDPQPPDETPSIQGRPELHKK